MQLPGRIPHCFMIEHAASFHLLPPSEWFFILSELLNMYHHQVVVRKILVPEARIRKVGSIIVQE